MPALVVGFWLFGAAVGAAATGVPWTFWAFWAMAWVGLVQLIYRHNDDKGRARA